MNNVIEAYSLTKIYKIGQTELNIFSNLSLKIQRGEAVCIVGSSGAGKSTLLHLLGTLDSPTSGQVIINGENIFNKNDEEISLFRNKSIGFVFQFHHLLKEFSALENVMMPCRIGGIGFEQSRQMAEKILVHIGLKDRLNHYPSELSGGEQQRVAIARALVRSPEILFADEPTGNIDSKNGRIIQDLFFKMREELKVTLVVVSHDKEFAEQFPRQLKLQDGKLI